MVFYIVHVKLTMVFYIVHEKLTMVFYIVHEQTMPQYLLYQMTKTVHYD